VRTIRLLATLAIVLLPAALPPASHAQRGPVRALVPNVPDSATLSGLRFRGIGPASMSGRISDIAVPPSSRPGERLGKTVYVASAAGGVWKTMNAGVTYEPVFDDQRVSSIGAIAVAPTNADVVWVGTGESNNLRSSSWGDGLYRSSDAGRTWMHAGLPKSQHIARIVVHPADENTVFVAAMGPLWSGGGERGLHRTTDGGRTWRNTLSAGPHTGVTDIVLDPRDPDVVYAATWQRDRRAYSFVGGGPESGIWKSTDRGEHWTRLTRGLPVTDLGRIGLAVSASQPNTLYATVDAAPSTGGIYRSDDAGENWHRVNELQSIPWFFGQIRVDPLDAERVYHLGVSLSVSDDGGATFRRIAANTHADHHALWIDPTDSDHLIIGNDGGLYSSHDRGATWDFAVNLPVSTFYAIGVDMRDPYWVYGGLQDNGTFGAPSSTRTHAGVTNTDWVRVTGGDGFHAAIDPGDHNVVFAESQNGALQRFDFATQERKGIRPQAEPGVDYRYNWMAPLLISPHDRRTLYFAANYLFRSRDRGDSWERLGGDLTRALNRDSLPIMGLTGPGGHRRNEGVAEYGNITTIDESPLGVGLLYVGTDDGLVQVSRDGGATWTRRERFPGVPDMTYVSRVVSSAHAEGTVYVTFDGHRSNDFSPYVLRSTDYGRSFRSIAGNLPADATVYVIREHHRNPDLLMVGTEYGVFATLDAGRSWTQLRNGIAPAPVHDVIVHPRTNDLVVGTHGRGIFILDDITALEQLATAAAAVTAARPAWLFAPQPVTLCNPHGGGRNPGDRNYVTENPRTRPTGPLGHSAATLSYFVGPAASVGAHAVIAILDEAGELVREVPAPLTPGTHRVDWDLRWSLAVLPPSGARSGDDDGPRPQPLVGPLAFPGTYRVQFRVHDGADVRVAAETRLEVRPDPVLTLSLEDHRELHATRMRARSLQERTVDLVMRLQAAAAQLELALAGRDSADAVLAGAGDARAALDALLLQLWGTGRPPGQGGGGAGVAAADQPLYTRVATVGTAIGTAHFVPTPAQHAALDAAERELGDMVPRVAGATDEAERAVNGLVPR
jgi:photosystem II stability/assembly factor-like uncharacterized protein